MIEHPTEVVVRQVKRGSMIGELALLMRGVRSASVRASRESEVTSLSREQFEQLVLGSPGFALGLLRSMAEQIAANRAPSGAPTPPATIAVVALDPAAPAARIGAELAVALSAYRNVEEFKPGQPGSESDFREQLKRAEATHDQVVLTTDSPTAADPWTRFSLKEADVIVAVTTGSPSPAWQPRSDGPARLRADRDRRSVAGRALHGTGPLRGAGGTRA